MGAKTSLPPLGLLTVAALLPLEWELRLVDLNTGNLTEKDWQWADVILLSAMCIQKEGFLALAREGKQRGKTVVAGGPYPTSLPEEALVAGCDFVVRGEGENTIPLLLMAMRDGKTGVIENQEKPDMTTSPIPRFDLLRLEDYAHLAIQTTRGCPFDCEFCDVVNLFGRKPRHKTTKQVIAELETLHRLGATGNVFFCDDNFIGSKKYAQVLLQELSLWSKNQGSPFGFQTQASLDLGQDLEMIDLLTEANLGNVFIGIESPDENVLHISRKYPNLHNPLAESVNNIKHNGMTVMGSFIFGLDGETKGAGKRICAFMDQTSIPIAMLGLLQAPPHTKLWKRLEKEGRLRGEVHTDWGGTFAAMNYTPDRPEAEIMQEYIDAWDYLYEPSRFLERAYRFYLAMRPTRRALAIAKGDPPPSNNLADGRITWRRRYYEARAFFKILWWQGIRPSYRRQFWTQLIGMWKQNPSRIKSYLVACAMGEDLFMLRRSVREKVMAIIKERGIEVPPAEPRRRVAS
ncbi:MAG: B12-binding domain-containing radical SAM protein [Deltaproteobacteria bacterium]|nr:B12-binding domain-containing radical SAM protein [Deltaproteobacteria bacterium]